MAPPTGDANTTPSLSVPPGVESDLENPPSQALATVIAVAIFLATATPMLVLRMYTRARVHKSIWWDDWTMIIGWIGLVAFVGLTLHSIKYGNGIDQWNVSQAHAARFKEIFANIEVVARISIFFTKLSICLLYLRYFCPSGTQRSWIWYCTWATIWFNFLYCIALVLTVTLQCVGRPHAPGQSCINSYAVLVTASVINVVTDLAILAIPLAAVSKLQMSAQKKQRLAILFTVGALGVASSVARLGYQIPEAANSNQTIVLTNVVLLALAEHTIGIIVGCMPMVPALYRHLRPAPKPGSRASKLRSPYWRSTTSHTSPLPTQAGVGRRPSEPYSRDKQPETHSTTTTLHDRDVEMGAPETHHEWPLRTSSKAYGNEGMVDPM